MRRPHHYILGPDGEPEATDHMTWARWFETADRALAKTTVDGLVVSTVFLSLDHRFVDDGPPILWETMIFGESDEERTPDFQDRYTSRAEAMIGHQRVVGRLRLGLPVEDGD